jgi:hypothetical protein
MRTVYWSCYIFLTCTYPLIPKYVGDVFFAKSGANITATNATVNFSVSIRDVGKESTLQGIEV